MLEMMNNNNNNMKKMEKNDHYVCIDTVNDILKPRKMAVMWHICMSKNMYMDNKSDHTYMCMHNDDEKQDKMEEGQKKE